MPAVNDSALPNKGANVSRKFITFGLIAFVAVVVIFVIFMTWGDGLEQQRAQAAAVEQQERAQQVAAQDVPRIQEAERILLEQQQAAAREAARAAAAQAAAGQAQRPAGLTQAEARRVAEQIDLDAPLRALTDAPAPRAPAAQPQAAGEPSALTMPEIFEQRGGAMVHRVVQRAAPAEAGQAGAQPAGANGEQGAQNGARQAPPAPAANAYASDADPLGATEPTRAQRSPTNYFLAQGSIIDVVLVSEVNTQNPGQIQFRVVSDVFDSRGERRLLIPRGTRLLGAFGANPNRVGLDRVPITINRMIFTDGRSITLAGGQVGDLMGNSGVPAEHHSNLWRAIGPSALVAWLGFFVDRELGTTQQASGSQQNQSGTQSVTQQIMPRIEERIAERFGAAQPYFTIEAGARLTLMLAQDLAITPFERERAR